MVTPKKEDKKYTGNNVFISPPKLSEMKDYHHQNMSLKKEDNFLNIQN
jgi:hypothetical protein